MLYNIEAQLRAEGFPPTEVADALNYRTLNIAVARTGEGWDQFATVQATARQQAWWKAYFGPSEGISSLASARRLWERTYSFDPLPALKSVRTPVLGLFGSLDTATPARVAAENMRRVLNDAGNRNVTVRIFEGANHPLMEAQTGSNAELPRLQRLAPGVFDAPLLDFGATDPQLNGAGTTPQTTAGRLCSDRCIASVTVAVTVHIALRHRPYPGGSREPTI